jgi:hypothetical protein
MELEGLTVGDKTFTWGAGENGGVWLLIDGPRGLRPASEAEIELAARVAALEAETAANDREIDQLKDEMNEALGRAALYGSGYPSGQRARDDIRQIFNRMAALAAGSGGPRATETEGDEANG